MESTATSDTNTATLFQISDDKYTASIELSNACREFYRSRIKAAEIARKKLECDSNFDKSDTGSNSTGANNHRVRKKTTIDIAMEQLRREMNSLMDQDLSLMKQLLILNETIEDLKVQRGYLSSRGSLPSSSCDLSESQWSVSETEMFESENELTNKYASPSTLSLNLEHKCHITSDFEDLINEANKKMCITKKFFERKNGDQSPTKTNAGVNSNSNSGSANNSVINNNNNNSNNNNNISSSSKNYFDNDFSKRAKHEEQNSFDSGIHETNFDSKITV
ncbi:putative uncharacterized protein DDB_G0272516 [Octopus sinensis]|uniref:Uncharacterized protein n=1 Tax=Octopus sinensis TaxID=2607531 RepID=A0A6P7SPI4_9MOLL|nr:putative uncharacterized protein DDB_G0272516 [Octopus sinensis]